MCKHEIIGDYYRGCGHFHGRYYSGEIKDCDASDCKTSRAHKHRTLRNARCNCKDVQFQDQKIINLYHINFPECERITRT